MINQPNIQEKYTYETCILNLLIMNAVLSVQL